MCFGSTNTGTTQTSSTPNPTVAAGATQNIDSLEQLMSQGYQPYTGQRVADFTDQQQQGFNVAGALPTSNPNASQSQSLISGVGSAADPTVSANSIASQMSPYMSQYVSQALQPQLQAEQQQFAGQDQQLNAAATDAGAFGDSRAGIQAANLTQQQDIANQGLVGNAYNAAFNTAIGAGAQDVSNQMAAQQQTGNFTEQGLQNQMNAATGLTALSGANQQYGTNSANLLEQMGGLQQQQNQANLNVPYSDYLAAQQYPFLVSQAMDSATNAGATAMPASTTSTTSQPNNSGYALLGALAPSLFNGGTQGFSGSALGLMLSDRRLKDNLKEVGRTADGIPVKTFHFKHDPLKRPQVGLVAQDVEKVRPEAVHKDPVTGFKKVDYGAATAPRRQGLEGVFGRAA